MPKKCKQGWDNDKSDGEYTKLHLCTFFTLEYLLCKKKMQGWRLQYAQINVYCMQSKLERRGRAGNETNMLYMTVLLDPNDHEEQICWPKSDNPC